MRELLRAILTGRPMFALLEPEAKHGGLSVEEVMQRLLNNERTRFYETSGLAAEVHEWGYSMPSAAYLHAALFAEEAVEWARLGLFQTVSMRLIANRIVKDAEKFDTFLQAAWCRGGSEGGVSSIL
jgi:hypothetical protein